ncbi:hypothetical protein ACM3BL_13350 [Mammaliicoccus sciuri]
MDLDKSPLLNLENPIDPNDLPSDMKKSEKIAKIMTLLEERTNTLQKEVTYIAHKSRQK